MFPARCRTSRLASRVCSASGELITNSRRANCHAAACPVTAIAFTTLGAIPCCACSPAANAASSVGRQDGLVVAKFGEQRTRSERVPASALLRRDPARSAVVGLTRVPMRAWRAWGDVAYAGEWRRAPGSAVRGAGGRYPKARQAARILSS